MPLTYYDLDLVGEDAEKRHPSIIIDATSRTYNMVRHAIDDKSVFNWSRDEALAMYKWYVVGSRGYNIEDEFKERVQSYDFRKLIAKSHYNKCLNDPESFKEGIRHFALASDSFHNITKIDDVVQASEFSIEDTYKAEEAKKVPPKVTAGTVEEDTKLLDALEALVLEDKEIDE